MKNDVNYIQSLIADNEIEVALERLSALDQKYRLDKTDNIILLKSSYKDCKSRSQSLLISDEQVQIHSQKIKAQILELLSDIDPKQYKIRKSFFQKTPHDEIVIKKLKPKMAIWYNSIYYWHKEKALGEYFENFGEKIATSRWGRKYFSFNESLKDAENASIEEIVRAAKSVINGYLGWSGKEQGLQGENLLTGAFNILYLNENATLEDSPLFEPFGNTAEYIMTQKNESLFRIKYKIPPYQNLGGLSTALTLNRYWDSTHIYTPFLLGLEESEHEEDIVVLIKKGKIRILNLELSYTNIQSRDTTQIILRLINDTNFDINLIVNQGQLFEDSRKTLKAQILTVCKKYSNTIGAREQKVITLDLLPLTPSLEAISSTTGQISCFYFTEAVIDKVSVDNFYKIWVSKNKIDYISPLIKIVSISVFLILAFLIGPYIYTFILKYWK